jgi:hypothetical protein
MPSIMKKALRSIGAPFSFYLILNELFLGRILNSSIFAHPSTAVCYKDHEKDVVLRSKILNFAGLYAYTFCITYWNRYT